MQDDPVPEHSRSRVLLEFHGMSIYLLGGLLPD